MLQYLIEGLKRCPELDEIVVATSDDESDEPISAFCKTLEIPCFRGPLGDVAGRFLGVITSSNYDGFVRISGDSPLLDHRLVSKAVALFKGGGYDIVTNVQMRTFPKGQSIEVLRASTFRPVYPLMKADYQKEHVTPYFYENPDRFSIHNFESGKDYGEIQLSVDTAEDMVRMEGIVSEMSGPHWEYTFEEILALLPATRRVPQAQKATT